MGSNWPFLPHLEINTVTQILTIPHCEYQILNKNSFIFYANCARIL
jgi:hypothetical protein